MRDIRFRYAIKVGLFGSLFTPIGVSLGFRAAKTFGLTSGGNGEAFILVTCVALIQMISLYLIQKVFPLSYGTSSTPPVNAEFLFYLFLDTNNCDAIVGDLDERYKLISKEFGKHRADFWYWKEALSSVAPIVSAWIKKWLMKPAVVIVTWAVTKDYLKVDSWIVMLAEIFKKLRP